MARRKSKAPPKPPLPGGAPSPPAETAPPAPAAGAIAPAAEAVPEEIEGGVPIPALDLLRRYLREIRKYPRLTREEERELAALVREKEDRDAALRLATSNLRLVVRIAMDYRRSYLNLLDLIQEGNIGLLHGIQKYDPYRGVPFSAYAGYWIRAYILKYLLDHWSLVRVGTTNIRRKLFYNLRKEQQRLREEGIDPGPKLLAQSLGADEEDVIEVSRALKGRDVSIDQPVGRGGEQEDRQIWETMPAAGPPPDEEVAREEMRAILREKIAAFAAALKEKERYILEHRLLSDEPETLQAIGDRFGTTREAVRQVEARLVKRLKEHLKREIKDLKDFEIRAE